MLDTKLLKIYYQNARGLRTKTTTFYRNVCLTSYDIIMITESWLLGSIVDSELFDERYVVFRRDRDYNLTGQTRGGGVLIAVRRDIIVVSKPEYHSSAEDLWITISLKSSNHFQNKLHICVLYLCNQNLGLTFSNQLINFFSSVNQLLVECPHDQCLIVGDFNLSGIGWIPSSNDDQSFYPINYCSESEIFLIDELNSLNLKQFNGINNYFGKILDLVLCNVPVEVQDASHEALIPVDRHHGSH